MPRPTQGSSRSDSPTPTGLSPAAADLSRSFGFARLRLRRPYNPDPAVTGSVWANPLSLAATRGITCCFLLLGVLRCFSSPRSPPDCSGYPAFCRVGCPIRVSADRFLPANPRGLSQLATPFIAYGTQGIPRAPFSYSFSAHSPDITVCRMRRFVLKRQRSSVARHPHPMWPSASWRSISFGKCREKPRWASRKEVFQPHLPVRLPCYDLTPVTGFTLGRSLRSRTSGPPGSHGLTGGVYKARERIHRIMADMRLLANPASRRRVAASDPNYDRLSRFAPPRGVAALCTGHCNTCVAPDVRAVLI